MSGPDQRDEDKSFLARWSQRKQEAKQPERDARVADAKAVAEPGTEAESPEEFDLASLPKLEDLTPTTDITAFLRKGVPEHLRNAALRKSWALDPAIRNYVNPALDYAYDWNTPGGVPGSSEIGAGVDVARLVSQIMGTVEPAAESSAEDGNPANEPVRELAPSSQSEAASDLPTEASRLSSETSPEAQIPSDDEAGVRVQTQQAVITGDNSSAASQQAVRRHGSAKPVV